MGARVCVYVCECVRESVREKHDVFCNPIRHKNTTTHLQMQDVLQGCCIYFMHLCLHLSVGVCPWWSQLLTRHVVVLLFGAVKPVCVCVCVRARCSFLHEHLALRLRDD